MLLLSESYVLQLPFPVVWSAFGPVSELGVGLFVRIQSRSSVSSCTIPQVPFSKSQSNSSRVLTLGGSVGSTGAAGLLPATFAVKYRRFSFIKTVFI